MSNNSKQFDADVLIVGSGVLGSLTATKLANAGKSVIILEAGPLIDRAEVFARYQKNFDLNDYDAPFPQLPYAQMWSTPGYIKQIGPKPFLAPYLRGVGGTTWHWASACWRLLPNDFQMKTLYGIGRDWPIFYDDLEPWYVDAEREIGVNGSDAEDQSGRNSGAFPPRSAPYPMTAQPFSSMNEKAKDILDSAGYPTIHEPNARASRDYDGRPACVGSNNCMPICPVGAQYSGERHADKAVAAGVKLITSAIVYKIELAGDKTVAALHYKTPTGESHRLTARRYVLAGHAIETPRLLLMSATDGAPNGVANSSGMVGRNLMNHPPTSITMVAKDELWPGRGPVQQNAVIPRRDGEFRSDRAASRHQVRNEAPNYAVTKGLLDEGVIGPSLDKQIAYRSARWLTIATVYEQLPDLNNRITLSAERRDALGLPSPDIFYDIDGYTQKAADEVFDRDYKDFARLFGGEMVSVSKEWGVQAHIMGTMIMGANAEDSVVDGFCRTHDHDNLFIASTGVMATASVVNPTLTGAALALRMAETIGKEV